MQTAYEIKKYFKRQYGFLPTEAQVKEELKTQELEDQGLCRSDAQAIVEAEGTQV